jgi:CDP-glucose 4,6-dehydratase
MEMDWNGKKVLITGASGFVGSWLTKKLIEKGADVSIISLWKYEPPKSVLSFEGVFDKLNPPLICDIRDYDSVKKAVDESRPQVVFHLAAKAIVKDAQKSPVDALETMKVNTIGTYNLLEASRNVGTVEAIALASTDKVLGQTKNKSVIKEDSPEVTFPSNVSVYELSKLCADRIAKLFFDHYGMPIGTTHCGNIYGGGDLNFSRIVPDTVRSIILGKNPVIRSDGTPVRNYIHIDDVVDAYITVAENAQRKDVAGQHFIFAGQDHLSVLDFVNSIIKVSGKSLQPDVRGKGIQTGELDEQYISGEKAKDVLKWEPKVKMEDGIKTTIDWYTRYFKFNPDALKSVD